MNDEEKKAIENLNEFVYEENGWFNVGSAKTLLNLIEKYQKEIEKVSSEFAIGKRQYEELIEDYEKLNLKNIEQQKEIEELKEQNQNFIVNTALEVHKNTTKNLNDLELLNEGWKKKIQDKIDEINNEKLNYSENEYYLEMEIKGYAIEALKELLESEG